MQLGNNPSFNYDGSLLRFVEFMILLQTLFESKINDQGISFNYLLKHLVGVALSTIQPCLYFEDIRYLVTKKILCECKKINKWD